MRSSPASPDAASIPVSATVAITAPTSRLFQVGALPTWIEPVILPKSNTSNAPTTTITNASSRLKRPSLSTKR